MQQLAMQPEQLRWWRMMRHQARITSESEVRDSMTHEDQDWEASMEIMNTGPKHSVQQDEEIM